MKMMKTLKIALAAATLACTAAAHAGEFHTENYGDVSASDFDTVVTDAFTNKFPAKKWSIFVWTGAGATNDGHPYCSAVAGVVPRNSGMFPVQRYETTQFSVAQYDSMTDDARRALEVQCARSAVASMMSADLSKVYIPYTSNKPSKSVR